MQKPFNPIYNHIKIIICQNAGDAIEKGYDYNKMENIKGIEISEVVVVKYGTINNNSTVDFILQAEDGQKFVCMITGNLLKSIPC